MSCESLEVQTPGNRQFGYLVGAFLQVILFFRLDKRDERRGPPPRAAEQGSNLQRLPAPKAAGEAWYDPLLANPPQPRLHNLRRVGRFGFVAICSDLPFRYIAGFVYASMLMRRIVPLGIDVYTDKSS